MPIPQVSPASLDNTLNGADVQSQQDAMMQALQQALAQHTAEATQQAQAAGQQYQQAAAAPVSQPSPLDVLIPTLFGNVASVLGRQPGYAEQGQATVKQERSDLLKARADNLQALRDTWEVKARAAQQAGDLEAEQGARAKVEQLSKQYDLVRQNEQHTYDAEQRRLDRENRLAAAKINASRPVGGATGAGFDATSVAQSILEGKVPPDPTGFSRGQWGMIVGEARKLDPNFNLMKAGLDYKGVAQQVRTLNQGQQLRLRQNAQNAMVTAGYIRDLIAEIRQAAPARMPVTVLNRAQLNAIKNGAYGPDAANAATRLEAQIAAWRLEMANVYSGGYAAQEAHLKEANHLIDPNWSLNRIEAGLGIGERDTNIRLNAVNEAGAVTPSNPLVPGAEPSGSVNIGPNAMPTGAPTSTNPKADAMKAARNGDKDSLRKIIQANPDLDKDPDLLKLVRKGK